MLSFPKVKEASFEPSMDCGINTMVLREIFKIMDYVYTFEDDKFAPTRFSAWMVRIEDQHDREDEKEPHYFLEVGDGDLTSYSMLTFATRYCDYHSMENGTIETDPGEWLIYLWLPANVSNDDAEAIAQKISDAYSKAMEKCLPDYEILCASSVRFISRV